jgi:hypothetical protein
LKIQQEVIDNLQPEGYQKIMVCKEKNTRKLLHLDFIFKLYMPLWCLEVAHLGEYVSYQEMKESESSIKKMKLLEQLKKTSFLTTRQYEKFGEFFTNNRILSRIFQLQRRSALMHKSKRILETTMSHFNVYPEDVKNNAIIKRIESLVKGYFSIQAKIRHPVIIIGEDGVVQERFDYDSLYVEDPNKQKLILDTQSSISQEIAHQKKDQFYLGDSQQSSILKKDEVLSKLEISRGQGDPNYEKEYAPEPLVTDSRNLFRSAIYRQSIQEELVEEESDPKAYLAREHRGGDTPMDLSLETKEIEVSPYKSTKSNKAKPVISPQKVDNRML